MLERLAEVTSASGTDWAGAIEARCRALLSQDKAAETLYRQAIERLTPTALRLDLARSQLLYGEWLRRERRPREAREQLRAAHELFAEFGMDGFTERARVELRATGEHARKRTVETRINLTPRETQISQLVAQGATNREIAEQLFVSPSHRRVSPPQGVYQARRQVPHPTGTPHPRIDSRRGTTDLTTLKPPGLEDRSVSEFRSQNNHRLAFGAAMGTGAHCGGHLVQGDASDGWRDDPTIDEILCHPFQHLTRLTQDKVHAANP